MRAKIGILNTCLVSDPVYKIRSSSFLWLEEHGVIVGLQLLAQTGGESSIDTWFLKHSQAHREARHN